MKSFVYKGRAKTGALVEGEIRAVDRKDALARLHGMDIVTLSLSPVLSNKSHFAFFRPLKPAGLYISGGLVIVSIIFFYWLFNRSTKPKTKNTLTSTVLSNTQTNRKTPETVSQRKSPDAQGQSNLNMSATEPLRTDAKTLEPYTNMPLTEKEIALQAAQEASDTSLRTISENVLALMASIPPDLPMPPMPVLSNLDEDFKIATTNIIEIRTNDTVEVAERKERVAWTKLDMAQLVKEGHKPEAVLRAIEAQHNDNATLQSNYIRYYKELQSTGKDDEAKVFLEAANKELEKTGSPPLKIRTPTRR